MKIAALWPQIKGMMFGLPSHLKWLEKEAPGTIRWIIRIQQCIYWALLWLVLVILIFKSIDYFSLRPQTSLLIGRLAIAAFSIAVPLPFSYFLIRAGFSCLFHLSHSNLHARLRCALFGLASLGIGSMLLWSSAALVWFAYSGPSQ
jgi:hypothetical protein